MMRAVLVVLAACSGFVVPACAPKAAPFNVALIHSPALDTACGLLRAYDIDAAWSAELEKRLPAMREAWSRDGQPLLKSAADLAVQELRGSRTVRLTLCDVPSTSAFGAVVNMRHALASFTTRPVSLRYKAMVASHELLHELVADLDLSQSALLASHSREHQRVKDHLHLFALMKAASVQLDRPELLAELQRVDAALPSDHYGRTWQLVEATPDTYLAYLEEVHAAR